ncbi:hypothetical protein SAMN04515671_3596 [Nakamurella panacisegetis]|uniref:Uncharacterized protein n=1 Tax=Nakamurella panacisegetis TaxID=1090615 RepID=A0A1H0RK49_9ACTN|nr:hypothetical protein [Nakamurella panacisegetis]SDP29386.1 hypothetical protein SAMN04515671_3596 [Nakamurella panacisegetis]
MTEQETPPGAVDHEVTAIGAAVGESAEHDVPGLRATFAERRLSVRTMDRPLRLATAGAAASLVGAALLVALRDVGHSKVVLLPSGGVETTLSTPLFIAALCLLAIGFGYLTTGVVLAHRLVGLLAVAVVTGALGFYTGVLGVGLRAVLPRWATWATRGLLLAIWLVAIGATLWRRHRHGDAPQDRVLRLVLLVVYCVVFGGYLLILRLASPTLNGLTNFPGSVTLLMGGLALLTTPILFVAAIDFGEWGQLTGQRLLTAAGRPKSLANVSRVVIPAALCVALLAVAWTMDPETTAHRLARITQSALIFAVAVLVLLAIWRLPRLRSGAWPETLNFAVVLVVAAIVATIVPDVAGLLQGQIIAKPTPEVSTAGEFTAAANVVSRTSPTGLTLLVPAGWQVDATPTFEQYTNSSVAFGALVLLIGGPIPGPASLRALTAGLGAPLGPVETVGTLQRLEFTPASPRTLSVGWLARNPEGSAAYLFIGAATGSDPQGAEQYLAAMVNSFRPPGAPSAQIPSTADEVTPAQAQQTSSDRLNVTADALTVLLALICLALLAGRTRGWTGRTRAGLMLFCFVAVLDLCYDADSIGRVLLGPATAWPTPGQPGVLAAVAVAGLVLLAIARRSTRRWARRLPTTLPGLAGGLLALRGVEVLYNHALAANRISVWAAVIVLLAISWDVIMSGESMTNHASRWVPRSSRVLVFLGYAILLACAVVFFSGQRGLGSGLPLPEVIFEPESITKSGLFGLAMPLMILLFLLHTFGEREPRDHETADLPPDPASRAAAGEMVTNRSVDAGRLDGAAS